MGVWRWLAAGQRSERVPPVASRRRIACTARQPPIAWVRCVAGGHFRTFLTSRCDLFN